MNLGAHNKAGNLPERGHPDATIACFSNDHYSRNPSECTYGCGRAAISKG